MRAELVKTMLYMADNMQNSAAHTYKMTNHFLKHDNPEVILLG